MWKYGIETIDGIEYKDANVVVIENKVACKLDLEVRFPMSILISTRENSNNTLLENNNIPEEFDDLTEELGDKGRLKEQSLIGKDKKKP